MSKYFGILFFLIFSVFLSLLTFPVFAQGGGGPAGIPQLEYMFARVVCVAVPLGYIALLVVLVIAGIKYLTSGGEAKAVAAAHQTVTWGLLGILFLAIAWLILQLVQTFAGIEVTRFSLASLPGVQGFTGSCWAPPPVAPNPTPAPVVTTPQSPIQINNPGTITDPTSQLMPASLINFDFGCRHIQNLIKAYSLESLNPIPDEDAELADVFNTAKDVPKEWLSNIIPDATHLHPIWYREVGYEHDLPKTPTEDLSYANYVPADFPRELFWYNWTGRWYVPHAIDPFDQPNQPPAKLRDDGNIDFYTYRIGPTFYFVPKNRKSEIRDPALVDNPVWAYLKKPTKPDTPPALTKPGAVPPNKLPSQYFNSTRQVRNFGLTTDYDEALKLGDQTTLFPSGTPNLAILYSMRSCPEGELWGIP